MLSITVNGVAYQVPSNASDTNWAAKQVAFEQALATAVNSALAAPSWTALTLTNSWANIAAAQAAQSAVTPSGIVYVRASIDSGSNGTSAFTLASGRRPPAVIIVPIYASGGIGRAQVNTDGTCVISNVTAGTNVAAGAHLCFSFSITS